MNVIDSLEMTRSELVEEVHAIPVERLTQKPAGGGWSVMEILEHLSLLEARIVQGIQASLLAPERGDLRPAPLELVKDRSRKLQAPSQAEPSGRFHTLADALEALNGVRQSTLEALASSIGTDAMDSHGFDHPAFGPMSAKQWVELIPLHEARHLDQIREVAAGLQSGS
ncbi:MULTISPECIES: DinB family protein [unclassified Paenibacillus]|uniref:DinB family protein n=1 Tax=unclassified Paenibacillus TaxID=185978 RepID=UPI000954163E|nr:MULTISPECIES: DinB family protein [unclassified Paenibacillus]ASS67429.2 DinB family protein [Paenibacillus sp. RUD330]SIQ77282.1 DinB superfamily protein [Paenibacillus sp. RU4X]SIQ98713.1 DinB superfamily protein [Paenibacillus sp. RU4T]